MTEGNSESTISWVAIAFVVGLGLLVLGAVTRSSLADPLGILAMVGLALIFWSVTRVGKRGGD